MMKVKIDSEFVRNRKIKFDIISSFFVLLFVTAASILWYTYTRNSRSLTDLSDSLITEVSKSAIGQAVVPLETAQSMVKVSVGLVSKEDEIVPTNTSLISYMREILSEFPFFSNIYIGTENGTFFQLRRLEAKSSYRTDPGRILPGGSTFALRYIGFKDEKRTEEWIYSNEKGEILDREVIYKVLYDHKMRDWYTETSQTRELSWSKVYVFNTNKKPGITISYPLFNPRGDFFGVVAIDITIDTISELLKNMKVGNANIFIMSSEGEMIAHPNISQLIKIEGDTLKMVAVNDMPDKTLTMAYYKMISENKKKFQFKVDDIDYVASFKPFPQKIAQGWILGAIVPTSDFIGPLVDTQKNTYYISFFIFLCSTILIWILAKRISAPIVKIAEEAYKIKNFDLSDDTRIDSNIYEIRLLSGAVEAMRQSLSVFAKFVPKALVKKLVQKGKDVRIGGQEKKITLLFTDIQGFTSASENCPPDKLMNHISEYFEELSMIIINNNGTIDKYIGDAIMAFWGAPQSDKKQALNACTAALYCQKRLTELNRKWEVEGNPKMITRIGIETGDVIVGLVGSSDRINYTAIGDTVNLASRLEGANKFYDTQIIIGEETYKEVSAECLVRPLDVVAVKGKTKGIKIYELVALKKGDPALMASKSQLTFCTDFQRGFEFYLNARWKDALQEFQDIEKNYGKDKVVSLYIERCTEFQKNPPPQNWDGIYHFTHK